MALGWVLLHRKLWGNKVLRDEKFTEREAWIWLFTHANHKDNKVCFRDELIDVKRGQLITSMRKLSSIFHWGKKKCHFFLSKLEKAAQIKIHRRGKRWTQISICNYEAYQTLGETEGSEKGKEKGKQRGNRGETDVPQTINDPINESINRSCIENSSQSDTGEIDKNISTGLKPNQELKISIIRIPFKAKFKKDISDQDCEALITRFQDRPELVIKAISLIKPENFKEEIKNPVAVLMKFWKEPSDYLDDVTWTKWKKAIYGF